MYWKKQLKWTMPAASVSWNCTRRRRRCSDQREDFDNVANPLASERQLGSPPVQRLTLGHPEYAGHLGVGLYVQKRLRTTAKRQMGLTENAPERHTLAENARAHGGAEHVQPDANRPHRHRACGLFQRQQHASEIRRALREA